MPVTNAQKDSHLAMLERLAGARGLREACSVVFDQAGPDAERGRALVVARGRDGKLRGAAFGVEEAVLAELVSPEEDADPPADWALAIDAPRMAGRTAPRVPGFGDYAVLPFPDAEGRQLGVVLAEAVGLDDEILALHGLFAQCGPLIGRALELETLREEVQRLQRQGDLLSGIVNSLPDPVLLTDGENNIVLANRRAEHLLAMGPEAGEGRRRAIQINNLVFSSFLTQTTIGERGSTARELHLVDPSDGSDLLFEALSSPLPSGDGAAGQDAVISILRDITDLKRAVGELEVQINRSRVAQHDATRERDRLDAILENAGDPILVTDSQSNIIMTNREAERLFEVPAGAGGDARRRRHVWANDTKFTSLISDFLLQPEQRRAEKLELTDPETGAELPVEVLSSKILDARGEPTAIVAVLHDLRQVVENQRLARELQQLNDDLENRIQRATAELEERNRRLEWQSRELEQASRLKSEFLANMSHELRTPINVLLGYTSLLRERIYGTLNEKQDTALEKVYNASQHLLELINDILDLSKIEAGKMPVHVEEVDLHGLVRELSDTVEPLLRGTSLRYETRLAEGLPGLATDRTKLKQILLNLLSNAIKFTHEGVVLLEIGSSDDDEISITVADTGIGIKPEHLATIFEDFRQVDQSPTREYPGTGLGLSITRKLLALLGGTISVESEYGSGSRFTISLPSDLRHEHPARGEAPVMTPAPPGRDGAPPDPGTAVSSGLERLSSEARQAMERIARVLASPD